MTRRPEPSRARPPRSAPPRERMLEDATPAPPSTLRSGAVAVAATLLAASGCGSLVCGPGTTSKVDPASGQARCVAAADTRIACDLDGGARLVGGTCVGDPGQFPTCGPGTFLDVDAGQCRGSGGTGDGGGGPCSGPIAAGRTCLYGQVYDLRTGKPHAGAPLQLAAYEPIGFLFLPDPKDLGHTTSDASGAYVIDNVEVSKLPSSLVAIAVTDVGGPGPTYTLAGAGGKDIAGGKAYRIDVFAVERALVAGWDAQLGLAGDKTFEAQGAYVGLFVDGPGEGAGPQAGVQLTFNAKPASDVFYAGGDRATLDAKLTATGAAGLAVQRVAPRSLGDYSGSGGRPSWDVVKGASIPGAVFVQVFRPAP